MKKKILKAVKLIGISVTASFAVLVVIYLFETKSVAADDNRYKAVVEDVVEPPVAVVTQEPTVVTTAGPSGTGPDPEEADTVIEETEEETGTEKDAETGKETAEEKETETETAAPETEAPTAESVQPVAEAPAPASAPTQPATEAPTPAPTQPATEAPTPAPTQPATEAPTQAPAPAEQAAPVFTSVEYTVFDKAVNDFVEYKYNSLEEAKAAINVPTLTDAEANAAAVANKATYAAYAQEVIRLINEYRAANGLAALTYNDTVATAAMHRAAESAYSDWNLIAFENGTSKRHIRPNFQKISSIADYYGISGNFGENYARFQTSPEEVVDCWKASPAHNALMLSTNYTKIGVGVAPTSEHAKYGDYYWVANFN